MSGGVIAAAVIALFMLVAPGCGGDTGERTESSSPTHTSAPESAATNTPTPAHATPPPATPAVNIQFVGDGDSSDESEATLTISPVPTKTPTQVGGEQDMSKSAGLQSDEVIAVPHPGATQASTGGQSKNSIGSLILTPITLVRTKAEAMSTFRLVNTVGQLQTTVGPSSLTQTSPPSTSAGG